LSKKHHSTDGCLWNRRKTVQKVIPLSEALAQGLVPGWNSGEGDCLLVNSKLGAELRRVVIVRDGRLLYDQWLAVESVGAATLPIGTDGKIGLVQAWRPVSPVEQPLRSGEVDLSTLGQLCWEIPRGFPQLNSSGVESSDSTATRETEEELGLRVSNAVELGPYRMNSTFFVNAVPIWCARVTGEGSTRANDPNEKILKATMFSRSQIDDMVLRGEISDGFTLAALTLYDVWRRANELPLGL
jgi:ADP-ribose pyrophosphatase